MAPLERPKGKMSASERAGSLPKRLGRERAYMTIVSTSPTVFYNADLILKSTGIIG